MWYPADIEPAPVGSGSADAPSREHGPQLLTSTYSDASLLVGDREVVAGGAWSPWGALPLLTTIDCMKKWVSLFLLISLQTLAFLLSFFFFHLHLYSHSFPSPVVSGSAYHFYMSAATFG